MRSLIRRHTPTPSFYCSLSSSCVLASRLSSSSSNSSSNSSSSSRGVDDPWITEKPSLDKKLVPPPPVFGFAPPKPGTKAPPSSHNVRRSAAGSIHNQIKKTAEDGEIVSELVFSKRLKVVCISARDVLMEDSLADAAGVAAGTVEVLSIVDVLSEIIEEEEMKAAEKSVQELSISSRRDKEALAAWAATRLVIEEQRRKQSERDVAAAASSSAVSSSPHHLIGALRVPEDIIASLRSFTEKTGSVSFSDVPSKVVRALVGHDGFTERPTLDDEAHPGIVSAVTRVVSPVGVFKVDAKRRVIKVRPGVAQLAARMDACIAEIWATNPSNFATASNPDESSKIVNKRVALGTINSYLTGTEKAFVADVGGLARVAAVFPSQFSLAKDATYVTRLSVPVGTIGLGDGAKRRQEQILKKQRDEKKISATTTDSAVVEDHQQQQSHFSSAVQSFRSSEQKRQMRNTTGTSLLAKGESIFAEDESDEEHLH